MTFSVRQLLYFSIILTVLLLIGLIWGFETLTIQILSLNHPTLDTLMSLVTQWAEWPVIVIAIGLSVYCLGRIGWIWGLAFFIEGAIVNVAKATINWPRPAIRFPHLVRQIDGNTLSQWKAFPSGHTAAAFFGTAIILSLWRNEWPQFLKLLLTMLAFAVAYSRVYLGQHSFEDVLAGAWVGLGLFWAFYRFFHHKNWISS